MTDSPKPTPTATATENLPEIARLLPHQAPMVLVDRILDAGDEYVHCQVDITPTHTFFDPVSQTVPGWVGIEFMAQTVAAWSGFRAWSQGKTPPIGFLLGSRRYNSEVTAFVSGQTLDIKADRLMEDNGMAVFSCRIECNGELLASSQLNAFVPSEEKLKAMQDRRKA